MFRFISIFKLSYAYPHKLLSNQFWTLEQILKFGETDYFNKVKHYGTILELLLIHADEKLTDSKAKNFLFDLVDRVKNLKLNPQLFERTLKSKNSFRNWTFKQL